MDPTDLYPIGGQGSRHHSTTSQRPLLQRVEGVYNLDLDPSFCANYDDALLDRTSNRLYEAPIILVSVEARTSGTLMPLLGPSSTNRRRWAASISLLIAAKFRPHHPHRSLPFHCHALCVGASARSTGHLGERTQFTPGPLGGDNPSAGCLTAGPSSGIPAN